MQFADTQFLHIYTQLYELVCVYVYINSEKKTHSHLVIFNGLREQILIFDVLTSRRRGVCGGGGLINRPLERKWTEN